MESEREDNKALADRLRGIAMSDAHDAGKQLSTQVGKMQTVKEISSPPPEIAQEQNDTVRERHVAEKQEQKQIGSPAGQPEQSPSQNVPEKKRARRNGGCHTDPVAQRRFSLWLQGVSVA